MAKILVGTYRSRRDADEARQELLERGFNDAQISVEGPGAEEASATGATTDAANWNASNSEPRGIAGVIARMFSDLFPDDADRRRYERALQTGAALVAVHCLDDEDVARARPILERNGTVDEHSHEETGAVERPEAVIERSAGFAPQTSHRRGGPDPTMPPGPDVTPLPNAPTGWNEAIDGSRAATGRGMQDPARPEGLTRGTNQLGGSEDRDRIERNRRGR